MSTASAPLHPPAASHPGSFYGTQGRHAEHCNRISLGSESHVPAAPLHMDHSEDDVALTQQSKRLAGLSITNFSGAKVSILNDSNTELASSPAEDPITESPRLSSSQGKQGEITAEECTPEGQPQPTHSQQRDKNYPSLHRPHHQESSGDTGRSSSLTNASTPIYSSLELASKASQRSRSLSGSSKPSPHLTASASTADSPSSSSASVSSPTHTHFNRSCSEDNTSDDPESYRRMSDPAHSTSGSSGTSGPTFVKRKYSCSYPGCNKCFTTSGHLARHNRIHTGERNFSCLMPGCPSRFSRQDNMMQHYRTHISPKSRRGIPKKRDYFMLDHTANHSQDGLAVFHGGMGHREQSPAGEHGKHHQHIAKMGSVSRHGSRQNSPPRFNPFDRSSSVEYTARNSTESHNGGGSLRHKTSGIIQTHQHHTPLPHFNVHAHALGLAHPHPQPHQSARATSAQGSLPSPLTPTMPQPQSYQHPSYSSRQHEQHHSSAYGSEHSYRPDAMLVSPTSPPTQDVERMDGVSSAQGRQGYYTPHPYSQHKSQYQTHHQSHYRNAHHSSSLASQAHAGHAHQNGYQLPPLSLEAQERHGQAPVERPSNSGHFHHQKHHNSTPPSPQSTPHTPTRYRFDPIQDCLQQDKQHRQEPREQYEEQNGRLSRFQSQYHEAAAEQEDSSMGTTTRSSVMSSASSMSSISSSSSSSQQAHVSQPQKQQQEPKREATEEMSGLAHLAQIVTTYG